MTKPSRKSIVAHLPALFRESLKELMKNDPLRMAGATAFFTTFALPPILIILIQFFRLLLPPRTIRAELISSISDTLGPEAVRPLVQILRSINSMSGSWYITAGGFIFLLFVSTTLFKIIKGSVNQVWKIRVTGRHGFAKTMRTRLRASFVILIAGVLFVIGIIAEGIQAFIGSYIFEYSPILSAYFNSVLNHLLSLVIVTLWFAFVFRFLPDGRPAWNVAFAGAFLTGVLFTLGKLLLHWLLTYSNINTVYGTSTSIVLLLLFMFYSSLILYFGAAFTKRWAVYIGEPIQPLPHAMHYRLVETGNDE
jgi:membrane protein